jgi:small subunit ribosomal protein S4
MARYTGADCKLCRREKMKLFLKGAKCDSPKCPIEIRPYPPGEHGRNRPKESEYLLQIREKQKARRIYGILERQFHGYYEEATRKRGMTGENLLQILESRLDNIVYRAGFAKSRDMARQLVRHGHFMVNGKKVDIPSYRVSENDIIDVKPGSMELTPMGEPTSRNSPSVPSRRTHASRGRYSTTMPSTNWWPPSRKWGCCSPLSSVRRCPGTSSWSWVSGGGGLRSEPVSRRSRRSSAPPPMMTCCATPSWRTCTGSS